MRKLSGKRVSALIEVNVFMNCYMSGTLLNTLPLCYRMESSPHSEAGIDVNAVLQTGKLSCAELCTEHWVLFPILSYLL